MGGAWDLHAGCQGLGRESLRVQRQTPRVGREAKKAFGHQWAQKGYKRAPAHQSLDDGIRPLWQVYVWNRKPLRHQTPYRQIMCGAMGDAHSKQLDAVRLLTEAQGKRELEIVRVKRMVKHWKKEHTGYDTPKNTGIHSDAPLASKDRYRSCGASWKSTVSGAPPQIAGT